MMKNAFHFTLTLFRIGLFGAAHGRGEGGGFLAQLVKRGTVIPYLGKFQKMRKSRDTSLGFC